MMEWKAKWIRPEKSMGDIVPLYKKEFRCAGKVKKGILHITALGVYEAMLDGERIGEFILAPGWTTYFKRLQYQSYDVTEMLNCEWTDQTDGRGVELHRLEIAVGEGWYEFQRGLDYKPGALIAQLELVYEDGNSETIMTDDKWSSGESRIRYSEIYGGECYDASFEPDVFGAVQVVDGPDDTLIPQEGEAVREQERIKPVGIFRTPAGETVIDFGQEITGYVEIRLHAEVGDKVSLSHGEMLDKRGNFYNANYRNAKSMYEYTCREGFQTYKPRLTFMGFRYVRVNEFPGGTDHAWPENFTAVVVHSQMKRTGKIRCSHSGLNRLFENIYWGQKGNFVDVPTDCPQRDERLGWLGDAQVFIRTACMNFDVQRFFTKWLKDMEADQGEDGRIGFCVPDVAPEAPPSAGWGDAAVICPWELYLAYGSKEVLATCFGMMKKWVNYITSHTTEQYLWSGGTHFGDWLALDAPAGSYKGTSRDDFIASAFYAYSVSLVIKAGHVLGEDMSEYEELYRKILEKFRKTYTDYRTQTECVLAVRFGLTEKPQETVDRLAEMIKQSGGSLQTGFIGTPYLLHVLTDYGYAYLAWDLLLRREYPSWLYQVERGGTTVWEHWDGIRTDGNFWSEDMNSFNHYAYGCVMDWVYEKAAGISVMEEGAGYEKIAICPYPDERLDWLNAEIKTKWGNITVNWEKQGEMWRYEIETPVEAKVKIDGIKYEIPSGHYLFYSNR